MDKGQPKTMKWIGAAILAGAIILSVTLVLTRRVGDDALVVWTAVYALAAVLTVLVLGFAGWLAWSQIRQASTSRNAAMLTDLSRRWDEPLLTEARKLASALGANLRDWVETYVETDDEKFWVLQRIPNFFEDVAVLVEMGAVDFEMLQKSLGGVVVLTWDAWKPAAQYLRNKEGYDPVYEHFEGLAERMREALKEYEITPPDTRGEIQEEG